MTAEEVLTLVDAVLAELGEDRRAVRHLATVERKAAEPGLAEAARLAGWPLVAHTAAVLAAVPVPNPSATAHAATGTPSVAEAASLVPVGGCPSPRVPPRRDGLLRRDSTAPDGGGPQARPPMLVPEFAAARLLAPKRSSARVTVAVARHPSLQPAP